MSKLNELIQELCPNGVEYRKISSFTKVLRGKRLTKDKLSEENSIPVYHGGIEPLGYYGKANRPANMVMIINVGASAGTVAYSDKEFWSSDGCFCIDKNEEMDDRYLYHYLKNNEYYFMSKVRKAGIPTLDNFIVEEFKIPVPPLEVQREIVHILDSFTLLTAELTAELTARNKQYEYYRDTLLTFNDNDPLHSLISRYCPNGVEFITLNKICGVYDGTHQTPKYTDSGIKFSSVENIAEPYATKKYISIADYEKYKIKPQRNDLLMTRIGSIGVCTVIESDEPLAYYVSLALLRPDNKVLNSRYLKYAIESLHCRKELRKRTLVNAVPIKINMGDIGKITVPVPPLEVQREIVEILDRFDSLCNDISIGLPAEIEARQKQYEFYRDKLLSFKQL